METDKVRIVHLIGGLSPGAVCRGYADQWTVVGRKSAVGVAASRRNWFNRRADIV